MDRLSGKSLRIVLDGREILYLYSQIRYICGVGGDFEASFCVVLPAQANFSTMVLLDQQYCNKQFIASKGNQTYEQ